VVNVQAEDCASQESIVNFKAAFILEASLFSIPGAAVGPSELSGQWAWFYSLHKPSNFSLQGQQMSKGKSAPECTGE
jgi:hypothetical protein